MPDLLRTHLFAGKPSGGKSDTTWHYRRNLRGCGEEHTALSRSRF